MNLYVKTGKSLLEKLNDHGFEAYFVGGFVRDFLLQIPSTDIDIATSATPVQVAALFPDTKETGLKFGTVTVRLDGFSYEVTTFRTDGTYQDSRHPVGVTYAQTLAEDLVRRDFTVNALAMDRSGRIIDLCEGERDLRAKILRAIGDPDRRFQEDALRILRAFRFIAKLNFALETATAESILRNRFRLQSVSIERIMQELKAIIRHPFSVHALKAMIECGIDEVFPDLGSGIRFLSKQPVLSLDFFQFYALCFHLQGEGIPDEWRFSNKEKAIIRQLTDLLEVTRDDQYHEELVYAYGKNLCLKANEISRLLAPERDQEQRILAIDENLPIRKTCDLAFKGQDLLRETPVNDARLIGEIISDLVLMVITRQLPNQYEPLKQHALRKLAEWDSKGNDHGNERIL
ncbi:MAG TPA: CCA tRNA nucleotidyltransferase [Candidatus Izemoplasmatales bacterium]|nr:CCA tRNA nucleotidyltransferase [Candidatus Izemoplasmatales bacterium]